MYANIGIIGIVNEERKQDYWGTCQKLADLGYKGLEGGGPPEGEDVDAALKRLDDMGLQLLTTSGNRYTIEDEIDGIIKRAKELKVPYVVVYWGPTESKEQVLADAEMYNRIGAKCAENGLKLMYHNHNHEFETEFDGKSVFDLYLENTDPDKVYFEVDVAWVTFGKADPVKILRENAGRIPVIHVKDLRDLDERGKFTAVGTGLVNIKGVMQAAIETGVDWCVIEQDKLNNITGIETAAAAIYNLREFGFVEPTHVEE